MSNVAKLPLDEPLLCHVSPDFSDYWAIDEADRHSLETATGRGLAVEALEYCKDEQCEIALLDALRSMILKGRVGPIELGFLDEICKKALS